MRALFYSLLGYFLTPPGVVAIGALDSSLVFFLPLGIDFVVIIMAARKPELFWLYALLATGEMDAAGRDAEQDDRLVAVAFENLMGDPVDGPGDLGTAQDLGADLGGCGR